jgi:hypothetical protein
MFAFCISRIYKSTTMVMTKCIERGGSVSVSCNLLMRAVFTIGGRECGAMVCEGVRLIEGGKVLVVKIMVWSFKKKILKIKKSLCIMYGKSTD